MSWLDWRTTLHLTEYKWSCGYWFWNGRASIKYNLLIFSHSETWDLQFSKAIFEHFSFTFKFDLCHDFSFWNSETGRCIPKRLVDDVDFYAFPPLCNRTIFDCHLDGRFNEYCPNTANDSESCNQNKPFFCKDSKTCISTGNITNTWQLRLSELPWF